MPHKTRRQRRNRPPLRVFNFDVLAPIMARDPVGCGLWQTDVEPDCSNESAFYDGHERVFDKYRSIFDTLFRTYESLDLSELIRKVPLMPHRQCKQIVIGAGEDIVLYIAINKRFTDAGLPVPFTLFMPPTWDVAGNLLFTQCAIRHELNTCVGGFFIRILLPKSLDRLVDGSGKARISLLEICTIAKHVHDMDLKAYIHRTPVHFDYNIVFI